MALPSDHGTWAFLLSPLAIGLAAGGRFRTVSIYLIVAALAGLLVRHPVTMMVKISSGRRPRRDLPAALFWTGVYGGIAAVMAAGLWIRGYGYLLYPAVPGMLIFGWYLILVSRRAERGRTGLQILGAGVLALSAPAGLWVGLAAYTPTGWLLWVLTWAQSTAAIVFVVMRLAQRRGTEVAALPILGRQVPVAVLVSLAGVMAVHSLGLARVVPLWLFAAYLPQWFEAMWFSWRPAADPPVRVGWRQLLVTTVHTVLFVMLW
jgi:hypothetical protein